jgi:hypothetical protein
MRGETDIEIEVDVDFARVRAFYEWKRAGSPMKFEETPTENGVRVSWRPDWPEEVYGA